MWVVAGAYIAHGCLLSVLASALTWRFVAFVQGEALHLLISMVHLKFWV
jgi:hypothetical protein